MGHRCHLCFVICERCEPIRFKEHLKLQADIISEESKNRRKCLIDRQLEQWDFVVDEHNEDYQQYIDKGIWPRRIHFLYDFALYLGRRCDFQQNKRKEKLEKRLIDNRVDILKAREDKNYQLYVYEGQRSEYINECTCHCGYGCICEDVNDWHTIKREDQFTLFCDCGTNWGCVCSLAQKIKNNV